jgi:hypothetical protein
MRSLCCSCTSASNDQLEEQKQLELLKLDEEEIDYQQRKDEVHELFIEALDLQRKLAEEMSNS